jgi:ribonucleoside-diphosphate reductase alpha chain
MEGLSRTMHSTAETNSVTEPNAETLPPKHQSSEARTRPHAVRHRLPDERRSLTHKFNVGGYEGYMIVGLYPDGEPGELFITMAKEGSTVSGLINSFAQAISIALQHGVPLDLFCQKFSYTRFEPCGWTGSPEIGHATSIMDYVFRWLHLRFIGETTTTGLTADSLAAHTPALSLGTFPESTAQRASPALAQASDAPSCRHCGNITTRNATCFVCANCGATSGCS